MGNYSQESLGLGHEQMIINLNYEKKYLYKSILTSSGTGEL